MGVGDLCAILTLVACLLASGRLAGQTVEGTATPRLPSPADSAEVHALAVKDQQLLEARRFQYLPGTTVTDPNPCAEKAGSLCFRWTSGWTPEPEPPEITSFRDTLLDQLNSLQRLDPGDGWILGQRVWYRGEAGEWGEALTDAGACGGARPWWCAALQGLALHQLGRYREAAVAFTRALRGMPPKEAQRWRIPDDVVSGGTARLLDHTSPAARDTLLERVWLLADPLYLVPGNDRKTAHYARWTAATIEEDAANPHRKSWNAGMTSLVVRHGWELAWTKIHRSWNVDMTDAVVGYNEPEGREFMPPASAVENPSSATAAELTARTWHPKSLYQPVYAPVLLPMDGQLALFPHGDSVSVIATTFVPRDTTQAAREHRRRPWMEAGGAADEPEAMGLFVMRPEGGAVYRSVRRGDHPAGASWRPCSRAATSSPRRRGALPHTWREGDARDCGRTPCPPTSPRCRTSSWWTPPARSRPRWHPPRRKRCRGPGSPPATRSVSSGRSVAWDGIAEATSMRRR